MLLPKVLTLFLLALHQLCFVNAFTDYLLKKCHQSGFCHRNREYSGNIAKSFNHYYSLNEDSLKYSEAENVLHGIVEKLIPSKNADDITINLPFTLRFMQEGTSVRFTIDEERAPTENLPDYISLRRYNETSKWAFDEHAPLSADFASVKKGHSWFRSDKVTFLNKAGTLKIEILRKSFLLNIYYNGRLSLVINDRSFLNIEHLRSKEENFKNLLPEESSFNMFKDSFEYSKDDTLPFGPESIAVDFTFKNYENLYGIPEHADSLRLRDTSEDEPYRLFNVDVFEYTVKSTSPMYGSIPFMLATNPRSSVGLFWVNAADTWIDIKYDRHDSKTHWISESGIVDVVLFFGDTPADILEAYTELTGRSVLPSLASIGYHQCRWNYNDELDVLTVDSEMDRAHIPYDYIWLDLEYTDEKKFFTWNPSAFPDPERLLGRLKRLGRQLVILIDPHIKTGYEISKAIIERGAAVRDPLQGTFFGECWPGTSVWIDTFSRNAQILWSSFLKTLVSATNLHIWNDMNEPSIFSGPETTAPKDLLHEGGFEERSVHNVYGLTVHETTYHSMKEIFSGEDLRPFILTRAFFAGSQRTAATWTGDNVANWNYLGISIPMCLSNNIVGMPFIGADIAGFSGDPEPELLIRWYQAGLWYPFFRGHAHIDTKRREPYLLEEPVKSLVRDAIQLRYSLLPTLYTAFQKTSTSGVPIMKPMFFEKPNFCQLYGVDDQFYIGDTGILVKPVVEKGITQVEFLLAPGIYYDLFTLEPFITSYEEPEKYSVAADLGKIPALLEGGHIIVKRDNYRRSAKLLRNDPFTLVIAPNRNADAVGEIYVDDGETFAYQRGIYLKSVFQLKNGKIITCVPEHVPPNQEFVGTTTINRINVALDGNDVSIKDTVNITQGAECRIATVTKKRPNTAIIENVQLRFNESWTINF
ncbi:hypothetical protein HG535_0B03220 [Zygotorulaspora mrakii]|uniref:Glucosidase II subunit alpha n=1 Tax=Zygotorulaspora mrakii TaxID=42260 RepID=A0A7H9AYK4_ZYGMR|nr:uncharacterized protein HG535_0B03220 [Zygotorulaspora mrakii]QLG71283.1 hypothetical protein HG535_0B03220 [Zygotorulaspora mrakii]